MSNEQLPAEPTENSIGPKKPAEEHWCEHAGCRKWGSFGFQGPYGSAWFCGEHREDGDQIIPRR